MTCCCCQHLNTKYHVNTYHLQLVYEEASIDSVIVLCESRTIDQQTFAGVVGAEGIGLKYSSGVPAPAPVASSPSLSWSAAAAGFGVLVACGVSNIAAGVPRLPPLPGVLRDDRMM